MKKSTIKISESQLKQIVVESVRRILKEAELDKSMSPEQFKEEVRKKFYEDLVGIFTEEVNKFCRGEEGADSYKDFFFDMVEDYATYQSQRWANSAIKLLQGKDWSFPKSNFRPLDFVMGEQGIHNFQELLAQSNPAELCVDWFWNIWYKV